MTLPQLKFIIVCVCGGGGGVHVCEFLHDYNLWNILMTLTQLKFIFVCIIVCVGGGGGGGGVACVWISA